jgi:hypothetical protein
VALLALAYLHGFPIDFYRYCSWGRGVPGIDRRESAPFWKIATIEEVGRAVDEAAAPIPHARALSIWSGYLFAARTPVYPEGHEAMLIGGCLLEPYMSAAERRRWMWTDEELLADIEARRVDLVVLGNYSLGISPAAEVRALYERSLVAAHYEKVKTVANADIYRRPL